MNTSNIRFLLLLIASVLLVAIFLFSLAMVLDITIVYGAEPSPTSDWGYVTPTESGYPVPQPTENMGYPYPVPVPTEVTGYPVPIPSDPPMPTPGKMPISYDDSNDGDEEDVNILSLQKNKKVKEFIEIIVRFFRVNKLIQHSGKTIFEMR